MSNNDATLPLGASGREAPRENRERRNSDGVAAAVTGAAGVAAGVGAYAAYSHFADNAEEIVEETVIEPEDDVVNPVTGPGNHVDGGRPVTPPVEPVTPPVEPVTPPVEPVTPPVEPVTPPVEPVTPPVEPVTPPVEPVTPPVEPVEPPVEPVEPQIDVVENPDDIADAIISGEEIDPDDLDSTGMFTFTEVETVYDIDGNETVEARYIDMDGDTGTMIDTDGDGVFDEWESDAGGITVPVEGSSFLTVADAELEAKEGYLAYEESQDNFDDPDVMEDIIDTTELDNPEFT